MVTWLQFHTSGMATSAPQAFLDALPMDVPHSKREIGGGSGFMVPFRIPHVFKYIAQGGVLADADRAKLSRFPDEREEWKDDPDFIPMNGQHLDLKVMLADWALNDRDSSLAMALETMERVWTDEPYHLMFNNRWGPWVSQALANCYAATGDQLYLQRALQLYQFTATAGCSWGDAGLPYVISNVKGRGQSDHLSDVCVWMTLIWLTAQRYWIRLVPGARNVPSFNKVSFFANAVGRFGALPFGWMSDYDSDSGAKYATAPAMEYWNAGNYGADWPEQVKPVFDVKPGFFYGDSNFHWHQASAAIELLVPYGCRTA